MDLTNNFIRFLRKVSQPDGVSLPSSQASSSSQVPSSEAASSQAVFSEAGSSQAEPTPDDPPPPEAPTTGAATAIAALRKFVLRRIVNVDETPMPYQYLDGASYELEGAKSVIAHTIRGGWSKRQATLIPYIFANGEQYLNPLLIFRGKGNVSAVERKAYHKDVRVEFNETVYNNEELYLRWIKEELVPLAAGKPLLLVWDTPLDTHINSWLKKALEEETDRFEEEYEAKSTFERWTVAMRRILATHAVAAAIARLHRDKANIISKSFLNMGIFVHPNSSEDHKINIKCIDKPDFSGWQETSNNAALKTKEEEEDYLSLVNEFDRDYESQTVRTLLKKDELVARLRQLDQEEKVNYSLDNELVDEGDGGADLDAQDPNNEVIEDYIAVQGYGSSSEEEEDDDGDDEDFYMAGS
ncbi:hypothetical protein OQA88_13246 [Cercophora sp. LCS_1]